MKYQVKIKYSGERLFPVEAATPEEAVDRALKWAHFTSSGMDAEVLYVNECVELKLREGVNP